MKVVIFAGGKGTRLSEETAARPKPMVEIGGRPILWHIMRHFAHYGHKDFVVLLGYKGYQFKEYFANYVLHQSDVTVDLGRNTLETHRSGAEDWRVSLIDTGEETLTAGRLMRARHLIGDAPFLMTYGDGVSDVNLAELTAFHASHDGCVTVTAVQPDSRYGVLDIDEEKRVRSFQEKPPDEAHWINGGFFVCNPEIFEHIAPSPESDNMMWERAPMEAITRAGRLFARKHHGFWQCMDTMRDRVRLEELWEGGNAPWKVWE